LEIQTQREFREGQAKPTIVLFGSNIVENFGMKDIDAEVEESGRAM